jgi:hypothetical protein
VQQRQGHSLSGGVVDVNPDFASADSTLLPSPTTPFQTSTSMRGRRALTLPLHELEYSSHVSR